MSSKKTGIMLAGVLGAVATTAVAGTGAIVKGQAPALGMITASPLLEKLPFAALEQLCFGGWDIRGGDLYDAALANGVIDRGILGNIQAELAAIKVYRGTTATMDEVSQQIFGLVNHDAVPLKDEVDRLMGDINNFKQACQADYIVVVNVCSTEPPVAPQVYDWDLPTLEKKILENDRRITPSIVYAYCALAKKCGFINFTPNISAELPALQTLARQNGVPLAGKDGKTGQTLYKTVIAPMFKIRQLQLDGWYSTNILGNNDGRILHNAAHQQSKVETKSAVLEAIIGNNDFAHVVKIDYYPPRGDRKEAWDNIDFTGWLGTKMSMKINWLGSDSALAAPLIIDLARLVEYAYRRGESGVLPYLGMFFKSPYGNGTAVTHDFFAQWNDFIAHFAAEL